MAIKKIEREELVNLISNKPSLGAGSFGEVFDMGDGDVFKFYGPKLFQSRTQKNISMLNFRLDTLGAEIEYIEKTSIYKIMQKYEAIKNAAIPKHLIFTNDILVGCLLDYKKGITFGEFMEIVGPEDRAIIQAVKGNLLAAYEQLADNRIYTADIKKDNALVDYETQICSALDVDDNYTQYLEHLTKTEAGKHKDEIMQRVNNMFDEEVRQNSLLCGMRF